MRADRQTIPVPPRESRGWQATSIGGSFSYFTCVLGIAANAEPYTRQNPSVHMQFTMQRIPSMASAAQFRSRPGHRPKFFSEPVRAMQSRTRAAHDGFAPIRPVFAQFRAGRCPLSLFSILGDIGTVI
ncbi:unnamed protein product [Allacma fusca]|uniref:Uncharacterized protein n=1 Tax=Allacma fusca TaxID=39272 RepID=A0A8J2PFA0_9HEXA|nr:unnamed protein product [Allacma fusca]